MESQRIISFFVDRGFDIHGRARGRSGTCHIVASKRGEWDYGDKQSRTFFGAKPDAPGSEWVQLKFSISRSALACEWVKRLTGDQEKFLIEAGLQRFRRLLAGDDTPGRSEEVLLHRSSDQAEFVIHDPGELQAEVSRVQKQLLELLWHNRYRGIKRTFKQEVEDSVCTSSSVLDSVLGSFEQRRFIKGAYGSSGIKITIEGEVELDRLRIAMSQTKANNEQNHASNINVEEYDAFISHASEDKEAFVRPLAHALRDAGLQVWYDEFTLKLGDSLRASIDRGLARSRYGLIILSHPFFSKDWTQRELNGLFARMKEGERRILPVWHGLSSDEVKKYSPMLADLLAANSADGIDAVKEKILEVVQNR